MVKPFSIQAPEQVAKEYGGNKQKIAEAAQLGIVDPTAAVLAGMFIDKMRTAQQMEGGQKPTIAQQVLGAPQPQPQPQAVPPQGAPPQMGGGLGATPQAMPPEMGAMSPEMGMAEGGIVGLDLPDTMFDEPNNGGYAPGGLVAFADGGPIDAERLRRALLMQESSGDYGALNEESGAMGGYQFTSPTARALAKRIGLPYRPELMTGAGGRSAEGKRYQESIMDAQMQDILKFSGDDVGRAGAYHFAGPDEKGWKAKTRQYEQDILRRYSGSKDTGKVTPRNANMSTPQGRAVSFEDSALLGSEMLAGLPREGLDRARAVALEALDPKTQEKERKADMWAGLAEMGFRMAATTSPFMLQAIGEAATATLPGIQASKKERKQAKNEAVRTLMSIEDVDRKTAIAGVELGMDIYKSGLSQEQFEQRMSVEDRQLRQQATIAHAEMQNRKDVAGIAAEQRMDKGLEGLVGSYLQMGVNEATGKGIPVDLPALRAKAYQLALAEWNKYKTTQSGTVDANFNGIPDELESGGSRQPTPNTSKYKVLGPE